MRLGIPLLQDYTNAKDFIGAAKAKGYRAVFCPGWIQSSEQTKDIEELKQELQAADIVLSEVGAWCNPLSPDPQEADKARAFIIDRLKLADVLGARCCVNILGSVSTNIWYAPDAGNFTDAFLQECVKVYRAIIDEVKPKHTKMAFEVMPFCLLDSTNGYLRLLEALDREECAVHLDLVNLINSPRTLYNHRTLFRKAVKALGERTVSAHVKDIKIDWNPVNTKLDEVKLGTGEVDLKLMLELLDEIPGDLPIMLEHLTTQEEYDSAAEYLRGVAKSIGYEI